MRTFLFCLLFAISAQAQQKAIQIWPGVAPGSENWKQEEVAYLNDENQQMIRNVVTPTLTAFLPDPAKATGTAVIVAPGGGFRFLSWQTEGTEVAEWLAARGVAAFVLKYRVMNTGTDEEYRKQLEEMRKATKNFTDFSKTSTSTDDLSKPAAFGQEDGRQAVKVVREHAAAWGINPGRIGIMGFSAGGMVTLGVALQHDAANRPNFAGAIYAPWSGGTVPADAPPMFILVAGDDPLASKGAMETYSAWKAAGIPAELHIYSKGGHGFGMQKKGLPSDTWIECFEDWLRVQGLLNPAK